VAGVLGSFELLEHMLARQQEACPLALAGDLSGSQRRRRWTGWRNCLSLLFLDRLALPSSRHGKIIPRVCFINALAQTKTIASGLKPGLFVALSARLKPCPPEAEHLSKHVRAKSWRIACFCLNEGRSHRGSRCDLQDFPRPVASADWHEEYQAGTKHANPKINVLAWGRIGFMMSRKVVLVFIGKVCSRGASLKDSCKWTRSVTSNLA
jgi:hypothetical protein